MKSFTITVVFAVFLQLHVAIAFPTHTRTAPACPQPAPEPEPACPGSEAPGILFIIFKLFQFKVQKSSFNSSNNLFIIIWCAHLVASSLRKFETGWDFRKINFTQDVEHISRIIIINFTNF